VLIPLLLLSKSKHQWSASIWTIVGKQAAYRLLLIVYRAGTLKAGAFAPASTCQESPSGPVNPEIPRYHLPRGQV